ncbi:MAG: Nif3-like dinuclear metal center hexameric protein [Phycisphaera sp.]|nr:MAG: Nif3-like dinuclear metal center hexameric protein [Phycisphaera sp.]
MDRASLFTELGRIAPLSLAEDWDNVGLLVGEASGEMTGPALCTIDLTDEVMDEAERLGCSVIVSYHPPIFAPMTRVVCSDTKQRLVHRAIRAGISVYSPHTAIDAAEEGLNDWLISGFGAGDVRSLKTHTGRSDLRKIVTYVPPSDAERVRNALASSGAGHIGAYDLCSFSAPGMGTFRGDATTNPAIGTPGELQQVEEIRLEMVCPAGAAALAVEALQSFHPYEEPAIDVIALEPMPSRHAGQGRRIVLDQPLTTSQIGDKLKSHLGIERLKLAPPNGDHEKRITHIGVCAGAGAELAEVAARNEVELFITGEMRHHEVLAHLDRGLGLILAGHTNTERGFLPVLAKRLRTNLPGLDIRVSEADHSPLAWV